MPFAPCCNPKLAEILSLESMTAPLSGPFNFYYIEISILSKLEADLLKKNKKTSRAFRPPAAVRKTRRDSCIVRQIPPPGPTAEGAAEQGPQLSSCQDNSTLEAA
jgi:hypothetical protein